jgi:ElaB/YqjD/DUF883 family membrane-anchored ribosome-binding protein
MRLAVILLNGGKRFGTRRRGEQTEVAKKRVTRKTGGTGQGARAKATKEPVAEAAAAVDKARTVLNRAQQTYEQARTKAERQAEKARALTLGDILDGTLEFVRRHPAAGILTAGLIGFLLGRTKNR